MGHARVWQSSVTENNTKLAYKLKLACLTSCSQGTQIAQKSKSGNAPPWYPHTYIIIYIYRHDVAALTASVAFLGYFSVLVFSVLSTL